MDKKALKTPLAYSYGVDNLQDDKGQDPYSYHREVYFWSIEEEEARLYSSWTLIDYKNEPIFGPYKFPTKQLENDNEIRMAIVGDMDNTPASQPTITELAKLRSSTTDMFLHLGDFAYDTYDDKGIKGDLFFQKMSSTLTTRIPYIVIGGNHEWPDKGRLFQYRF